MDFLVEAERKYMAKLTSAMAPVMIDAFYELFQEAKKQSQGRKVLIQYQALLKEVKNWNNTIVKQHTESIIKSCAMFPNLLAAVFVILVKIMSAIKVSGESKKLNIKLPTNDVFVHSCYMAVAASLYEDPYIMIDDVSESERRTNITGRITKAIREVVEDFVPVQQILDTYIPSFTGGSELDMGGDEPPLPPVEQEEALPEIPQTEQPSPSEEEPVAPAEEEIKEVPVTEAPAPAPPAQPVPPAPPVHQETLFDDAPETPSKK